MKHRRWAAPLLLAAGLWRVTGQTTVDLSRQGKLGSGTTLPARCAVGQLFFKTDAAPGSNLYACASANTWVVMGLPTLGGDASGTQQSLTVKGIQGRGVSATAPADQNVLRWNAGTSQWEPGVVPATGSAPPPATCTVGNLYLQNDPAHNIQQLYICSGANTWSISSSRSGLAANRPANCVAGQTWLSTDTASMTYCSAPGNPGVWSSTLAGPAGPAGANGNTVLNGSGAPQSAVGANGDFYLDTAATCLYGPKASGDWPGACTSMLGNPNLNTSSGTSTMTATYSPAGVYQTLVEPACNEGRIGGTGQIGLCTSVYLTGYNNPGSGGNLIGRFENYAFMDGHNTDAADGSGDKKTVSGAEFQAYLNGGGQKQTVMSLANCNGVGDCFTYSGQATVRSYATADGDEGNGILNGPLLEIDHVFQPTTGTLVKSTCTGTLPNGVTAKSAGPTDAKTVNFTKTSGACNPGDVVTIDAGNAKVEVIVLAAVSGGTITALFQSLHSNGAAVAPSPVLNPGGFPWDRVDVGWGQGQWVVDLDGTTYTTGTAAAAYGSTTVTGSGTTWKTGHTNGPVGGDANYPGCIAWPADDVSGVRSFDAAHPLRSWYPIASVGGDGSLTLTIPYNANTSGASGPCVWSQCAPVGKIMVSIGSTSETISGVALIANAFPWTSGHKVEQTIYPRMMMQHSLFIATGWWGPGELNNNISSANVGRTTIAHAFATEDLHIGPQPAFHNAFYSSATTDQGGIEVLGRDSSGFGMAFGTLASPADNKKIHWCCAASADINPDSAAGFSIDTLNGPAKLTLGNSLNTIRTVTFDYTGVTSASPVLTVPNNSGGILGVITGSPANNDCAKFSVAGGVTTITSAGAACGAGGASLPSTINLLKGDGSGGAANSKVAITSPTTAATIAFSGDNITTTLVPGTLIASTGTATQYTFPYFADSAGRQLTSWSGGPIGDDMNLAAGGGLEINRARVLFGSGSDVVLGSGANIAISPGVNGNVSMNFGAGSGKFVVGHSSGATGNFFQGEVDGVIKVFVDASGAISSGALAGAGKLPACIDANGKIYKGTNTGGVLACP